MKKIATLAMIVLSIVCTAQKNKKTINFNRETQRNIIKGKKVPIYQIITKNKEIDLDIRSRKDAHITFINEDDSKNRGYEIKENTRIIIKKNEDHFLVQISKDGKKEKYSLKTKIKMHNVYHAAPYHKFMKKKERKN